MFGIRRKQINNAHAEAIEEDSSYSNVELQQSVKNLVNQNQTLIARDALASALGESNNGKRNVYDVYGYPQTIQYNDVYQMVRRDAMARRIAFGLPSAVWGDGASIQVDEEDVLVDEMEILAKKGLFTALKRAHAMARMGNMSIVFVGIADNDDFSQPLSKGRGNLIESCYFRAYAYDGIQPSSWETDVANERYGLPNVYQLRVISRGDNNKAQNTQSINVHHTRVVALSVSNLDNDLEGMPTLEAVFNLLLDLRKATGGSAEAYFRNCSDKTVFEIDPAFAGGLVNNTEAKDAFDTAAQSFVNGMKSHIMAVGSKVTNLQTNHHSPLETAEIIIWQISAITGEPKKLLIGEGSGQLSGQEDKAAYNEVVADEQQTNGNEWLNNALEILDFAGIIDLPEKYKIDWPVKSAFNEKDEADINLTKSATVKNLADAKSSIGGDGLDLKSSMKEFGLDDIKFEEPEDDGIDDAAIIEGAKLDG